MDEWVNDGGNNHLVQNEEMDFYVTACEARIHKKLVKKYPSNYFCEKCKKWNDIWDRKMKRK